MSKKSNVILGVVRDTSGNPVAGARLYFTAGPVAFPDIAALTDAEGAFSLGAPAPGAYTLQCVADEFAAATVTVIVKSGQTPRLEIKLGR